MPAEEKAIRRVLPAAEAVYITGQARNIRPVMAAVVPERERVRNAMGKVIIKAAFVEYYRCQRLYSGPKRVKILQRICQRAGSFCKERDENKMSLFSFLTRIRKEPSNKNEHFDEQKQWDKMWVKGDADSPYAELMTYQSEVENGGHDQYFFNIESTGNLQKEMTALRSVLPTKLQKNLQNAQDAWLMLDEKESDSKAEAILEQCDDEFYKNEEEINAVLKEYASKIVLHT